MTIYSAEKALKDNEAKIPADVKDGVNAKITALRGLKDGTDLPAIQKALEELSTEMSKIGEAMSKAGGEAPAGQGQQTPEEQATEVKGEEVKPEGEELKA